MRDRIVGVAPKKTILDKLEALAGQFPRKTSVAKIPTLRQRGNMAVQRVEPAERETDILWREIRRTKNCIAELRELHAFIKGIQFAGKQLPVSIGKETMEHIEMLLTADLVRLKKQSAT